MGKHEMNYLRVERDFYPTPSWVTAALVDLIDIKSKHAWEPACGDGRMAEPLKAAGAQVFSTDIEDRGYAAFDGVLDFLSDQDPGLNFDAIITNPPWGPRGELAKAFIEIGLHRMRDGFLALLLPVDFDSAKTRTRLFGSSPQFVGKVVLTRRIKWFEDPLKPKKQPKENSAWFLWGNIDLRTRPIPVIRYAPQEHQSFRMPSTARCIA
jgi:hypothetical protein